MFNRLYVTKPTTGVRPSPALQVLLRATLSHDLEPVHKVMKGSHVPLKVLTDCITALGGQIERQSYALI
jgi:hypothetical protein